MSMIVRMATTEDIEKLVKIRFDYFNEENWELTDESKKLILSQLHSFFIKHLNIDFFAAFVEIDSCIASTAFLAISEKPANPSFPTGKTGTVLNVFTYPQYRKMGYPTKAMNLLIAEGKRQNLSYMELSSSESGRPLYQSLGFLEKISSTSHFTEMKLSLL